MLNEIGQEPSAIKRALEILDQDGVVGIPTETVYGLAARLDRPKGLEKIFSVKQRPFFDPLIVHVESVEMAKRYVSGWNTICTILSEEFWPGPLSLVLDKSESTPDIVTAGLTTVAVRMPRSLTTLDLIRQAGVGLAAPSANRFGKTSPTTGAHVASEFGSSVFVVDERASEVGIESTVLRVRGNALTILRPGLITRTIIENVLNEESIEHTWEEVSAQPKTEAPGQMKHHYMPDVPLILAGESDSITEIKTYIENHKSEMLDQVSGTNGRELILSTNPVLAAREFYGSLRSAARSGADFIYFRVRKEMAGELWSAIFDRLNKAASLRMDTIK